MVIDGGYRRARKMCRKYIYVTATEADDTTIRYGSWSPGCLAATPDYCRTSSYVTGRLPVVARSYDESSVPQMQTTTLNPNWYYLETRYILL